MSESMLGYNWMEINPSEEQPLPIVISSIYEPSGELSYWRPSNEREHLLEIESAVLHDQYPGLFNMLSLVATHDIDEDVTAIDERLFYYDRGACLSLLSLNAMLPFARDTPDVSLAYQDRFLRMDVQDIYWWMYDFDRQITRTHLRALGDFVLGEYRTHENAKQIAWLAEGATGAYIISAHNMACYEREREIAYMTRDEESYLGWLAYRNSEY